METIAMLTGQHLPVHLFVDIFKSAQAAMVVTDTSGVIQCVNGTFSTMTGYKPEEVLGLTPAVLKGNCNSPGFYKFMWMTLLSGEPWRGRFHNKRKDGSLYWVEQTITPLFDASGKPIYFVAVGIEISEAQEAYELEAKALRALRVAVEAIDESFVVSNEKGELLLCNARYRELYVKPQQDSVVLTGVLPVALRGLQKKKESTICRIGDRWVRLIERKTQDGYTVNFHVDITDLVESHLEAEKASHAKTEFLANMSHEIRTPLNVIIGLTELARNDPSRIASDYLQQIQTAATTLLSLVNDVLDFSKSQVGQFQLDKTIFDLDALLEEVMDLVRQRADEKKLLFFMVKLPEVPRYVYGDPLRVKQVLINLLTNAVKFTESGSVFLTVRDYSCSTDAVLARFSIVDTGIGMPSGLIDTLFEPFVQADASTTRKYGGTGLGLAITKQLVELMGGKVEASSELGKWSAFNVDIPFERASSQAIQSAEERSTANAGVQQTRSDNQHSQDRFLMGTRVLLVEDNSVNQSVGKGLLEILGAKVSIAENGQAALDAVVRNKPDLILMDLQMPVMGGVEAACRIQQDLGVSDIPIYALTAHTLVEEQENCLAAGMVGFITKPVTLNSLSSALAGFRVQSPNSLPGTITSVAENFRSLRNEGSPHVAASRGGGDIEMVVGMHYCGDDPVIYREALELFLEKLPELDDKIKLAFAHQKLTEMKRFAHSLRGMAGAVGAIKLQKVAGLIERSIGENEPESLNVLSVAMEQEIEAVLLAAELILPQLKQHEPNA